MLFYTSCRRTVSADCRPPVNLHTNGKTRPNIGRVNCFTTVRHTVPDGFLTYSGKSRISSRVPSFTDTTAVCPGSTSLLVPYW